MESLFVLIPLAIILCGVGVKAFLWAVDHHQFDDLDSAAQSILFDEDQPPTDIPSSEKKHNDD